MENYSTQCYNLLIIQGQSIRLFKNRLFSKWAEKEGLSDHALWVAVDEMERGLIDAELGGHIVKKRVAIGRWGKSGGVRPLLAYKVADKAFFIYGFAKNERANISSDELKALKYLAKELLGYSDKTIKNALKGGVLIEVENSG